MKIWLNPRILGEKSEWERKKKGITDLTPRAQDFSFSEILLDIQGRSDSPANPRGGNQGANYREENGRLNLIIE